MEADVSSQEDSIDKIVMDIDKKFCNVSQRYKPHTTNFARSFAGNFKRDGGTLTPYRHHRIHLRRSSGGDDTG